MLVIYVNETDVWEKTPLYEAVIRRWWQLGIAGATAQTGIMGFWSHLKVHHKRLFGVSDDRPVTISVVEDEEALRKVIPEIKEMVSEGLMVLLDVEVIAPERP